MEDSMQLRRFLLFSFLMLLAMVANAQESKRPLFLGQLALDSTIFSEIGTLNGEALFHQYGILDRGAAG
jgi:hypothetical protein